MISGCHRTNTSTLSRTRALVSLSNQEGIASNNLGIIPLLPSLSSPLTNILLSYMHTYARRTSQSYQICSLRTRFPLAELLALRFLGPDKYFVDAAAIHVDDLED